MGQGQEDTQYDTGDAEVEVAKLLALLDTSGPMDDDDDTSGIEDQDGLLIDPAGETSGPDEEDETGAVELSAMGKIAGQINPKKLSVSGLARGLAKAKVMGKKGRKKRRRIRGTPAPSHIVQARRVVAKDVRSSSDGPIEVRKGFYFYTMAVEFDVVGTTTQCVATLDSGKTFEGFHKYVDDTVVINGQNYILTESWTNLAKNGATNYPKQEFLIERTTFSDAGVLIFYDETAVNATSLDQVVKDALLGKTPVFDEDGVIIPKGIYHDQTGRNELFRALSMGAVLRFAAIKTNVGSNRDARDQLVDSMENIPTVGRGSPIGMSVTSGGADWPYHEEGWRWKLDLNDSEAEEFRTTFENRRRVSFGFAPAAVLGTSTPTIPKKIVLLVKVRHEGTSYRKIKRGRNSR